MKYKILIFKFYFIYKFVYNNYYYFFMFVRVNFFDNIFFFLVNISKKLELNKSLLILIVNFFSEIKFLNL